MKLFYERTNNRIIESRLTEDPIADWDYGDKRYSGPSLQKNKRAMSDILAKVDYMIRSGKSPIFIAEYISTEIQHDKEMFRTHYEYTGDWEHFKKEYTKAWDKVLDYIDLAKVSGSEDSDWVVNIGDLTVTFSRGTKLGVISNPRNIASAVKAQMIGNEAPTSKEDARELVINAVTGIIAAMRGTSLSESKKRIIDSRMERSSKEAIKALNSTKRMNEAGTFKGFANRMLTLVDKLNKVIDAYAEELDIEYYEMITDAINNLEATIHGMSFAQDTFPNKPMKR